MLDMIYQNVYFINGTAYAGKSTMVRLLAEKHHGIACVENFFEPLIPGLNARDFPNLTYTRDLENWSDFVRRTPEEYEAWINGGTRERIGLELKIIEDLSKQGKKIFVDTGIPTEVLWEISDCEHVLIMLADPDVSVRRFFERPDREKQFIYQLLMKEPDPAAALDNFRECLKRTNSRAVYEQFLRSGFHVLLRDDSRTPAETLLLVEAAFGLR